MAAKNKDLPSRAGEKSFAKGGKLDYSVYMDYKPTIGLEIHAELKTKTKMFCSCKNDTDEKKPNVNICPICLGHPGTLPVINKEAVRDVLKVGLAVGGNLADESEFDRKNYFYPDIPKGYQISQYKYPLVSGGELVGVRLTRVHLEEDTAKSTHLSGETSDNSDYSLVDFNRAGVPLMELVTEPVIKSAAEAGNFARELQLLLRYLDVAEANMEKGEMRVEANISVSDTDKFGTKVEVKNLNSFRAVERAIDFEIKRQVDILEGGGRIVQETRGWDEDRGLTFSQRTKEESHDYRYFPDPDLPKLKISGVADFNHERLRGILNETPNQKRTRFTSKYGIKQTDIEFYISNIKLSDLFEKAATNLSTTSDYQLLSNYITSDIAGFGERGESIDSNHLADLIAMISKGLISSRGAKDILIKVIEEKSDPNTIANKYNLFQKSDEEELIKIAKEIISSNQSQVLEYKNGKTSVLQFLIGQGMKATKGSGNPQLFKDIFTKLLS